MASPSPAPLLDGLAKAGFSAGQPDGLGLLQTQRDWWAWWFIWSALCILAYLTNPTAASFRTHLTSLSFSTHLRRLSTNNPTPAPRPTPTRSNSNGSPSRGAAPSHVLSFSNRISVAVRTPAYTLKSYYFFSTVVMQPAPPSTTASNGGKKKGAAAVASREGEVWVGAFGRWYPWRWESEEAEEEERKGRLANGVMGMDVEEDSVKDEPSPSGTPANSTDQDSADLNNNSNLNNKPNTGSTRTARPSKRVLRGGQRRSSPTSLARLRAKAESSSTPATPDLPISLNDSNNANSAKTGDAKAGGGNRSRDGSRSGKDAFPDSTSQSNQRLPGHFSLNSASNSAEDLAAVAAAAVAAEETDPVLIELKAQLDELRATAAETERRLQDELEVLRGRKKEEDNFRAELKAKTKQLEEQKRVAELQRVEAERELNERKARLREARERVTKLQAEIAEIDKRDHEAEERREKKKRDRKEREKKLREDVLKKRDLLKAAEQEMGTLRTKLISVEKNVEIRRELLLSRRTEITRAVNSAPFHPNQLPSAGFQPNNGFRRTPGQISAPFGGHVLPHHAHLHANMGLGPPPGMLNFNHSNPPNSRPSSIRSGHYDHNPQHYQSAPSSPVLTQPLMVNEDGPVNYQTAPAVNTTDPFYGGVFAPDAFRPQHASHQGFLEHRIQHRTDNGLNGVSLFPGQDVPFGQAQQAPGTLPSTDDIPHAFLPFDFESPEPGSRHSTEEGGQRRHQLALPMQYLDSGLLAGSMSPTEGPLSPMTPHQTSLIPSQLFHMLDEDDEDEQFVMPDSPTITHCGRDDWMGLGLDVNELGAPASTTAAAPTKSLLADLHENSSPATEQNMTAAPLSPIGDEPRSPLGPVSPTSEKSEPRAMSLLPSPRPSNLAPTNATTTATSSATRVSSSPNNPQQHLASVFGFAPSPWDSTDQLLSSRLSPAALESVAADDLPRAGLSLNPDAKAFAFQPPGSADAARAAFAFNSKANTTVPALKAAAVNAAVSGSANSPTVAAFNSVIGPPAKSRMDFAQPQNQGQQTGKAGSGSGSGSTSPVPAAANASGLSTGFAFDWQKGTTSPAVSDASPPPSAAIGKASFDPWNSDDLLGPLK